MDPTDEKVFINCITEIHLLLGTLALEIADTSPQHRERLVKRLQDGKEKASRRMRISGFDAVLDIISTAP